ncbi:MAG: IS66 family transposase [Candidatus Obscuribacterales bacterium]|nr:IS66 family transposase [Candidatus Obscuribacterales bacterium]
MKKKPQPAYSSESLNALDKDDLIKIVLSLNSKVEQLSDIVQGLVTQKYGAKTERFKPETSGQLNIFTQGQAPPKEESAESPVELPIPSKTPSGSAPNTKKPGHSRKPIPDNLLRVPVTPDSLGIAPANCSCCGKTRSFVREILQHSRYQYVPASFYVEDLMAHVFECSQCPNSQEIVRVPEAVKNGIAGSGLMAQIAVARGTDHSPFNRQSVIYQRSGVELNRSTIADTFAHTASIIKPIYDYMHENIIKSKVIATDDTPVKVQDRSKDKNIKTGRIWVYLGDQEQPYILFDYTTSRARNGPLEFLKGFQGYLQGDCFSGNLAICAAMDTVLVACLAHARRYFIRALLNDRDGCNKALAVFQSLYEIERTAKELQLSAPEIKMMREQEAVPILEQFHSWLKEQYMVTPPTSSFGKALYYCLNNWNELNQYVQSGALSIDNNISEREMKYIAMGRKSWLFLGSDNGGKNHATILSILSTCRRHGVEPWSYLNDVIQRLTENPACDIEELLPHNWKPKYPPKQFAELAASSTTPKFTKTAANSRIAQPLHPLKIAG